MFMVMPNYRRAPIAGGTFFFTVVTYRRRPILTDPQVRSALRNAVALVRQEQPFVVDAWVLLPDHMHCIWTLPRGDANFSRRWGRIKAVVTKQLSTGERRVPSETGRRWEGTIWQRRFWEHRIRDSRDLRHHMDYVHYNPVRHGLVSCVAEWPFSSFHRLCREGVYPHDWGGLPPETPDRCYGEP